RPRSLATGWAIHQPSELSRRPPPGAEITKELDSGFVCTTGLLLIPGFRVRRNVMLPKRCAACDCNLDGNSIKVSIGGKTVEVCCDECAQKLKEAHASAIAERKG